MRALRYAHKYPTEQNTRRYSITSVYFKKRAEKKVAKKINKRYEEQREESQPHCMFARVELDDDLDQWQVRRQNLRIHWEDEGLEPLEKCHT
jgi:hypothetical protein